MSEDGADLELESNTPQLVMQPVDVPTFGDTIYCFPLGSMGWNNKAILKSSAMLKYKLPCNCIILLL